MASLTPCCVVFRPRQTPTSDFDLIAPKVFTYPNAFALDPYVSHLRLAGRVGEVFLICLRRKEVLARRKVR
jgi:hypothetical protein